MIVPMTRVEIVCLSSVRAAVVNALHEKGLLHLEEVATANESAPNFLDKVQLEGEEQAAYLKLEESERTLNEIAPLLTLQPSALDVQAATKTAAGLSEEQIHAKTLGWAEQLRAVTRARAQAQDQIEVLKNYRGILDQVAPALGGSNVKLGKGTRALVLNGNVKKIVARLDERLRDEVPGANFHRNQVSRKQVVGLLSFPADKEDIVSRILGQEGITPVDMRDQAFGESTVSEVLARIDQTIAHNEQIVQKNEGVSNKISRQVGAELLGAKAVVADRLARLRVHGQFAESQMVTVIEGWTADERYEDLVKAAQTRFPGQVEVNRINCPENALPPTLLRNHSFFKPFELVMGLFKPPTYGTVDPTWMVGLTFTIFYGFIVGDAGYGLCILLLSLWIKSKWGKTEIGHAVGTIAMYMGISAIVFGFIYGEYFGNFVEKVLWPKLTGHELHPLFHRAHRSTEMLVFAILFGVFLIPLSLILGIREKFKHGHAKHALEQLGMLLALIALLLFVMGFLGVPGLSSTPVLMLCAALAVAGSILIFYTMKVMGLVGLIEVISLGGNIMSYARLMALGIAGIALADMANMMPGILGGMIPGGIGYVIGILMALLIHVANLGISVASPTIHSLRLNFVEFLPKFYSPEGKGFNPFRKETQW